VSVLGTRATQIGGRPRVGKAVNLLACGGLFCYNWNVPQTNNVMTIEEIKKFEDRVTQLEKHHREFHNIVFPQFSQATESRFACIDEELTKLKDRVKELEGRTA
jgi:hypothetical protein